MQLAQSYLQGTPNPFGGLLEAYGQGQVLGQNRNAMQAAQAEQQRKLRAQNMLETLDWNDQNAIAQLVAQYPEYTKGAQDYYNNINAKEQQAMLFDMSTAISALGSDRPDIAIQATRDKANAYADMGDEAKAQEYSMMAEWMTRDPQAARKALMMNYALLSPKDSGSNYKDYSSAGLAEDMAPYEQDQAAAETAGAYAGAKKDIALAGNYDASADRTTQLTPYEQAVMESDAAQNMATASLKQTQADDIPIARADTQAQQQVDNEIAQMKLAISSEANDIRRGQLQAQLQGLQFKKAQLEAGLTAKQIERNRQSQVRMAEFQGRMDDITSGKSTVMRLLNNKSGLQSAVGALQGRLPSVREDTRRFEGDLETLKSQQFLTNVQKLRGMGALSNMEGSKVEQAIANLDLKGSETTIRKQLGIIYDSLIKLEKVAQTEYQDLVSNVQQNPTNTSAGRSYMQYAN